MPDFGDITFDLYGSQLDACRAGLVEDLSRRPGNDLLSAVAQRGKMLRPLLVFAAASAVGGNPWEALLGARAVELLHLASLIHDDIIDDADKRRGLPAVHVLLGVNRALVVGDYLLLRSLSLVADESRFDADTQVRLLATLLSYAEECCRGELAELESSSDAPENECLAVAKLKTGSQFAAAAAVGAILGGGSDCDVTRLREYGVNLGAAFQIEDDLADLTCESHSLGKPALNSLINGRATIPLLQMRHQSSAHRRAKLWRDLNACPNAIARLSLLESEGVLESVRTTQKCLVDTAISSLDLLPDSEALALLRFLPFHLLNMNQSGMVRDW